jgi:VanZ family protein
MKRTKRRLAVCLTLLVFILTFIWGNSCLPGEISGAISAWLKDLLARLFGGEMADTDPGGHGLLRKMAHATEFFALGLDLCWLMHMLRRKKPEAIVLALLCGFAAACTDECIQMFVPGRGPGWKDVGIDTLGVALGVGLLSLILTLKHGKTKLLEENKL